MQVVDYSGRKVSNRAANQPFLALVVNNVLCLSHLTLFKLYEVQRETKGRA